MIDLHMHTTYSDGTASVEEVLKECFEKKLELISITDHNTVEAYKDIEKLNVIYNLNIVPGCEVNTLYNGIVMEILAYGFDVEKFEKLLMPKVLAFDDKAIKEAELIFTRFEEIGVKFDRNNIIFNPKIESCRRPLLKELAKYPENERFFFNKEAMHTYSKFSRGEVYNVDSGLYVDLTSLFPTFQEVIDMIHEAGGKAFLAHPFVYQFDVVNGLDELLHKHNLDGLECFYTKFTDDQTAFLLDYCYKNNLYISGGSDYHGTNKTNHDIGIGRGNLNIPKRIVSDWHAN